MRPRTRFLIHNLEFAMLCAIIGTRMAGELVTSHPGPTPHTFVLKRWDMSGELKEF